MTAAATAEPARPKLALNKKRVVNVAALKQQSTPIPVTKINQPVKKTAKQLAHEQRMKEQAEAAEKKRAEKAAKHAEFLAQQTRLKADEKVLNRIANEEAEKRATAHREAFEKLFYKLTMVGCKKPLALNSYEILLEYARNKISPDIAGVTVRRFISKHCGHANYLDVLAASAEKPRYHPLSGEIIGTVTAEEAAHASQTIEKRRDARKITKAANQAAKAERRTAREAAEGDSVLTQTEQTGTDET